VAAVRALRADLSAAPFLAPGSRPAPGVGLGTRAIAAAQRAGLLRVSDQIVLGPGAAALAGRILARLPQPFTTAQARQALGSTRPVAFLLVEYLDAAGATGPEHRAAAPPGLAPTW
jgi:selenocysteine-specific elongation factor